MRQLKILSLLLFISICTFAQDTKKAMSIIDFLNIPGVSNPQLAPDGSKIIYRFSESDWKQNKQISHIWQVQLDGSDARQLTFSLKGEHNPLWSPDGKWISFLAKRNGDKYNQLYIMRADGGEAKRITNHKAAVTQPQWASDSKRVYFIAKESLSKEEKTTKKLKDDVYAFDENFKQKHLWKVMVEDGIESRITKGDFSVLNYHLSTDGNKIALQQGPNPLVDFYKESEVWIMNADGSGALQLTNNTIGESGARISPNGQQLLFRASVNEKFETYFNSKLFIISTNDKEQVEVPTKDLPYGISTAEWSADGKSIFFVANMGSQVQLWQYMLKSKKFTQLTKGKHSVGQWHYSCKNNVHLMGVNSIENPGDIHILKKGKLQQITHHYDYLKQQFQLPKQEVISWKGKDGVTVEGLIYYPYNYVVGKKYPLVVQTHGGPASSDKYGMSRSQTRYNPVLTGKGYVVLQPNYRGSTGYGDDFLRDMVGGYFRQAHLDVMTGVDYLIERGIADPDKMVKMGWSAGGHMTNKIITFTNRFKAASSGAGAVNWIGMYAQSDTRTYRTPWFGGTPWQENAPIDAYWDHSPLKDISKAQTPTLVFVGENDVRVPMMQSVELYRALRSLGVPTHLYVAPREPHGWKELRHRLYKINLELDWFSKYALNKNYEWEKVEDIPERE